MLAIIIILCIVLIMIISLFLGGLFIELDELSRRSQQLETPMDNDEYDYGHDVDYKEDEE